MLFNSGVFLLGFLPLALAGFFAFGVFGRQRLALGWLTLMSLVFYGWWNPVHVPLLLASMGGNYLLGRRLGRRPSRALLVAGIAGNVLLLGYFKYTGFAVETLDGVLGAGWAVPQIVLPLAISFYTFQQIAYLSDAHDGVAVEHDFLNYCLFVTFFPHLIAGPITHHREMLTQFADRGILKPRADLFSIGATLFLLGLFKKVMIADQLAGYVSPVFAAAERGAELTLLPAWGGALAYALQLYFDFSGYTDMAIGLGLLFGISLPPNFDSPYKARNVIDFWSRWHMTLTRFLTAYIYNPVVLSMSRRRLRAGLAMPRRGKMTAGAFAALVAFPTVLTMAVSGLWHGAGWQFVVFGLLHGAFLTANHGWRALKARRGWKVDSDKALPRAASVLLTFACVVVAQVFFRAPDVPTALSVLSGMAGLNGLQLGQIPFFSKEQAVWTAALLAVVWALPNPQQWMRHYRTALGIRPVRHWIEGMAGRSPFVWRPTVAVGVAVGAVGCVALVRALSSAPTEFLYFQF